MSHVARTVSRLVAVLTVLVLGIGLVGLAPAHAAKPPRAQNDTRAVGMDPVTVAFPIQYFGIVADLAPGAGGPHPQGSAPYGEARFHVGGRWTDWQGLDQDGAQAAGHFTGSLISVNGADAYQVRNVPAWGRNWRAAAINTSSDSSDGLLPKASAATTTTCMSRADWGADESISGWSHGDVQAFYPDQVITVHHTAGSNNLDQDYAATVRAIYSYHVQTNLWSDIGYQYLVDGHGVVYEGRNAGHTSRSCLAQGGDGTDFAHQSGTDNVVTGAHAQYYNNGNIGIALMGCYENGGGCSGDTNPPAAAVDSLETQLASLSVRHGLHPDGTTNYVNPQTQLAKTNPTVSGHRDWNSTACPGGNLYAELPAIRATAAARMGSTPTPVPAPSAPGTPTGFTATASGPTVKLSWSPPASDGGSAISYYEVYRGATTAVSTSSFKLPPGSLATTADDTPGPGSWYYAVRACNAVGCSPVAVTGPVSPVYATITSASCRGTTCSFSGTGNGQLAWTFGNGAAATGSPVTTSYSTAASYTVTLSDTSSTSAKRTVTCASTRKSLTCSVA